MFTKCDECPEAMEDPRACAENNTSRLVEFCKQAFSRYSFFAASVAGSSGLLADSSGRQMSIPFHVQPTGIVEPLQWIIGDE